MDLKQFASQREAVAEVMSRLYQMHLTTTSGGNISCRLTDDLFCITPGSLDKAHLHRDLIAIVTMTGINLTPDIPLSIETDLHRSVLAARPEIKAVVHAHPCYASAFSAMNQTVNTRLTGESWALLGEVAIAEYAPMGTEELAQIVAQVAQSADAILMRHHGALTVGRDLLHAYDRQEVLENCARMTYITETLAATGRGWVVSSLSNDACSELRP
jgi:L-fuculose-phosphate aldolase